MKIAPIKLKETLQFNLKIKRISNPIKAILIGFYYCAYFHTFAGLINKSKYIWNQ